MNTKQLALLFSLFIPLNIFAAPITNLYVIGDSLSDQGNLFSATVEASGSGAPASDHYTDGRFSNGEIAMGLLAGSLGITLTPSFDGGTNFAYGGARTDYNRAEASAGFGAPFADDLYPWTLRGQIADFNAQNINDPDALFAVWSGSNDLGDMIPAAVGTFLGGPDATAAARQNLLNGIHEAIDASIAAGAQNILVPNIPNLGNVPLVIQRDQAFGGTGLLTATATMLVTTYNMELDAMLDSIVGVNIIKFDTFSALNEIVANPASFGFSNAADPCYTGFVAPNDGTQTVCDTANEFVFWDIEHPSTVTHRVLANQFRAAVVPEPSALALVLIGSLFLFSPISRRNRKIR